MMHISIGSMRRPKHHDCLTPLNACEIDNTLDKIVDTDTPSTMLEVDPLVLSFGQVVPVKKSPMWSP